MKKLLTLATVALMAMSVWAQSEAQKEVTMAFGINDDQSSKPAELFHKDEPRRKASGDIGFQANIDVEGLFSRMPGVVLTDWSTGHQWIADPFRVGGVSMGGGIGLRYRQFLYVGAAFSFFGDWGSTAVYDNSYASWFKQGSAKLNTWVVPIYADLRLYIPTDSRCYPFFEFGIGGYVGMTGSATVDRSMYEGEEKVTADFQPNNGFFFQFGLGAELKYFNVGVGYRLFDNYNMYDHYGYVKLGVSLGRPALLKEMY